MNRGLGRILIFLICACPLQMRVSAQRSTPPPPSNDYVIKTWSVDDGLPQSSVTYICQTTDGYLWVGTWNGLARFDGRRFVTFHSGNTPALRSSKIDVLCQDPRGGLWIAVSGGGVVRYDRGVFTVFDSTRGLTDPEIHDISVDHGGNTWIATSSGVFVHRNDTVQFVEGTRPAADAFIDRVVRDSSGTLWIGYDRLLLSGDVRDGRFVRRKGYAKSTNGMEMDSRQRIWIRSDAGSFLVSENGSFRRKTLVFDSRYSIFWPLQNGRMGICGLDGMIIVGDSTIETLQSVGGVPLTMTEVMFEDKEGNIWIGRASAGLTRLRRSTVRVYSRSDGLSWEAATSVAQARDGTIWVGTYRHGLHRFTGRRFVPLRLGRLTGNSWISTLANSTDGAIWIGQWAGGLDKMRNGRLEAYVTGVVTRGRTVIALQEDSAGGVWVGTTNDGMHYDDHGKVTVWDTSTGLPSNSIVAILPSKLGGAWVGTRASGIVRIVNDSTTTYDTRRGLASDEIRTLWEDDDGSVWVGSRRGLNRIKGGKIVRVTESQGLPDEAIAQILEDDLGNLWFGGIKGIFRVSKSELRSVADGRQQFLHAAIVGTEDGMMSPEVGGGGSPSGWRDKNGLLWFCTENGVVVIDPSRMVGNLVPPSVHVEEVTIDDAPQSPGGPIVLQPENGSVEFRFTAISFRSPNRVWIQYMLEGMETEFRDAGTRRIIQYTNLPPGSYTFRVRGANSDGVWSPLTASVGIMVLPPFWKTTWFLTIAVVFFVASGPMVYILRVRSLKREQERQQRFTQRLIETQEDERRRIAGDLHDGVGQDLLVIKSRVQRKLGTKVKGRVKKNTSDDISPLVVRTLNNIRAISHNLHPNQLYDVGLERSIDALAQEVAEATNTSITTEIDDIADGLGREEQLNCFRIIQEALNNIVKHARATDVVVRIRSSSYAVTIEVVDNGIGMQDTSPDRYGFGLKGIAERVKMSGGSMQLRSSVVHGTAISITIPKKKHL